MDKVEDIVGRMKMLINEPVGDDLDYIWNADEAMEGAINLIQSQQALIEEMREGLRKVGVALEFEDKSAILRSGVKIGELIAQTKALSQKDTP